jgi:hypothetical protein
MRILLSIAILSVAFSASGAKKPTDDTSNPAYSSTPVVTTADTSGKPAKPAGFVHPGILVNRAQSDEIKTRGCGDGTSKVGVRSIEDQ